MSSTRFIFKHFIINQGEAAMKVTTDSIVFGSWLDIISSKSILDIGTGTGLLALMMAQRNQNSKISAVEIDKYAYCQAKENFEISKWKARLTAINEDFKIYSKRSHCKFDTIVSNPPFYDYATKSLDKKNRIARHQDTLSYSDLLTGIHQLLKYDGRFYVMIPYDQREKLIEMASDFNFFCNRKLRLRSIKSKNFHRIMLLFQRIESHICSDLLTIFNDRKNYTKEFMNLTSDYYL